MKKTTPPQSSLSFQQLVLGAAGLVGFRWRAFVIGALSFALLTAVAATFADAQINKNEAAIASEAGISREDLQKHISSELESLSEPELLQYIETLQKDGFTTAPATKDNLVVQYVIRTGPYVIGLMLTELAILFACFVYFLSFFGNPIDTAYEAAQKLPLALLRMVGLVFWAFFTSFAWFPVIGPFVALYFIPRFALAPAILTSGEAGVAGSMRLSRERTKNRWFSVFLRLLGILFIALACLWVSIIIAGSIGLFFLKAGFFLWLFSFMATVGFVAALIVVLGAGMR